ncbi:hypothetical protein D3C81_1050080 [compost metagenome]
MGSSIHHKSNFRSDGAKLADDQLRSDNFIVVQDLIIERFPVGGFIIRVLASYNIRLGNGIFNKLQIGISRDRIFHIRVWACDHDFPPATISFVFDVANSMQNTIFNALPQRIKLRSFRNVEFQMGMGNFR